MSQRATATFDLDTWKEEPYDDLDGTKLTRSRVTKTFHGDVVGRGIVELLMAYAPEGSGAYCGLERIVGTVHGRSGSFILQHVAVSSRSGETTSWSVVPDSGTGELRGMRGTGEIVRKPGGGHTFTLDYELD